MIPTQTPLSKGFPFPVSGPFSIEKSLSYSQDQAHNMQEQYNLLAQFVKANFLMNVEALLKANTKPLNAAADINQTQSLAQYNLMSQILMKNVQNQSPTMPQLANLFLYNKAASLKHSAEQNRLLQHNSLLSSNTSKSIKIPPLQFQEDASEFVSPNIKAESVENLNANSKKIKKANMCDHPDRPHYAKNMCNQCYHKFGRNKKPWKCNHEKLYAHGLCQNCYINAYNKRRNQKAKQEVDTTNAANDLETDVSISVLASEEPLVIEDKAAFSGFGGLESNNRDAQN